MLRRSRTFTLPQPDTTGSDGKPKERNGKFSVFKGLLLAMLSGAFYSLPSVIVKKMKNLHPGQLAVYRFISILVFSLPTAVTSNEEIMGPKDLRFLIFLRSTFGAANMFLSFIAYRYLPLGEAAVIMLSVPVFVTVAARVFLKEPCGIFQSITVFLAVIGIILTTKIPLKLSSNAVQYTQESVYGILAAIAALLCNSCIFVVLRKVKGVHHSIIMFNNGWVATIEAAVLTAITGDFKWHDCELQGFYIIVLGAVSYIAQTLLTLALQCELAGPVSTMRAAVDLSLAFVWQTLLFDDIPDGLSISGAVLVGLSVLFVGLTKWASSLPPESPHLKYLGWVKR